MIYNNPLRLKQNTGGTPVTPHRIVGVDILNPFNDRETATDKLSILDIKARDQDGVQFNVEMQMLLLAFTSRIAFYLSRLHSSQLSQCVFHESRRFRVGLSVTMELQHHAKYFTPLNLNDAKSFNVRRFIEDQCRLAFLYSGIVAKRRHVDLLFCLPYDPFSSLMESGMHQHTIGGVGGESNGGEMFAVRFSDCRGAQDRSA